jgi:hypothetical protein
VSDVVRLPGDLRSGPDGRVGPGRRVGGALDRKRRVADPDPSRAGRATRDGGVEPPETPQWRHRRPNRVFVGEEDDLALDRLAFPHRHLDREPSLRFERAADVGEPFRVRERRRGAEAVDGAVGPPEEVARGADPGRGEAAKHRAAFRPSVHAGG